MPAETSQWKILISLLLYEKKNINTVDRTSGLRASEMRWRMIDPTLLGGKMHRLIQFQT